MPLVASSLCDITAAISAAAAVPVYPRHCIVSCIPTSSSVKSLRHSTSLDCGFTSNFAFILTFDFILLQNVDKFSGSSVSENCPYQCSGYYSFHREICSINILLVPSSMEMLRDILVSKSLL